MASAHCDHQRGLVGQPLVETSRPRIFHDLRIEQIPSKPPDSTQIVNRHRGRWAILDKPQFTADNGKHDWHLVLSKVMDQALQLVAFGAHSRERTVCRHITTKS